MSNIVELHARVRLTSNISAAMARSVGMASSVQMGSAIAETTPGDVVVTDLVQALAQLTPEERAALMEVLQELQQDDHAG